MKGCFARGWSHEAKLQLRTVETITSPLDLRPHTRLANQSTRKLLELFFSLRESDSAALAWDQRALCEKVSQVSVRISQIREPWSQASISCRDQQFHGMLVSGLKKKKSVLQSKKLLPSRSLYNAKVYGKFSRSCLDLQTYLTTKSPYFPWSTSWDTHWEIFSPLRSFL